MKKIRYWWWLFIALLSKHRKVIIYTVFASILFISFVPKLIPLFSHLRPSATIGVVGRFRPSELPVAITKKISQGLTSVNEQGEAIPALATHWSISEDGKIYTFSIDPEKKWQDGASMQSSDLQVGIENVSSDISDQHTIVFTLKEPFAPFPAVLSRPVLKPKLIGTGDYAVKSIKKNGEFVEELELLGPNDQTILYRFYRNTQDVLTAFRLGEVNTVTDLANIVDIPKGDRIEVTQNFNPDRYLAVFFNTKAENLSEKSFRQALTYAIQNKPTGEKRALSPINPHSWAYNPQVKPYNTDLDQAKELLHATFADKELPNIELTTFSPYVDRADEIAKAWADIGIKTTVRVATSIPTDFQALLIGQQIPPDPDQYFLWHSTQNTNLTHYASPKIDKLLEDGRKTLDQNKRVEMYQDFQRFLLEDAPAAFLEHITTYTVTRK